MMKEDILKRIWNKRVGKSRKIPFHSNELKEIFVEVIKRDTGIDLINRIWICYNSTNEYLVEVHIDPFYLSSEEIEKIENFYEDTVCTTLDEFDDFCEELLICIIDGFYNINSNHITIVANKDELEDGFIAYLKLTKEAYSIFKKHLI